MHDEDDDELSYVRYLLVVSNTWCGVSEAAVPNQEGRREMTGRRPFCPPIDVSIAYLLPLDSTAGSFQPIVFWLLQLVLILLYHVFSLHACLGLRVRATPKSIYGRRSAYFFLPLHSDPLLSDFILSITVARKEP